MIENERGFLYLEAVFVICAIFVFLGTVAMVGRNYIEEALLEYEAISLAKDIRLLQEEQRTNSFHGFNFEEERRKNKYFHVLRIHADRYELLDDSYQTRAVHTCLPLISLVEVFGKNDIGFLIDGTPWNPRTIELRTKLSAEPRSRYVIIDQAGRVRIDRVRP